MVYFPRRFIVGTLLFFLSTVNYFQRVSMSIAIIPISAQYRLSPKSQGLLLSSFYWGYLLTNIFGAHLAKKFSAKAVITRATALASVLYLFLPFAIHANPLASTALHAVAGAFQGPLFPAVFHFLGLWFPPNEHSIFTAIFNTGVSVGTILAMGAGPPILVDISWEALFFIAGGAGLIWCPIWVLLIGKEPRDKEDIVFSARPEEIAYIEVSIFDHNDLNPQGEVTKGDDSGTINWKKIAKTPAVYALIVNHFASNWGYYLFLSWLPTYMKSKQGFDVEKAGIYSFLSFILFPIAELGSAAGADYMIGTTETPLSSLTFPAANRNAKGAIRKFWQTLSCIIPAAILILISFVDFSSNVLIALITISVGLIGLSGGGFEPNYLDLSPKLAGHIFGISNTIATLPGITGVYIVGYILQTTDNRWDIVFLLTAGIYLLGMVVWLIWASGEPVLQEAEVELMEEEEPFFQQVPKY